MSKRDLLTKHKIEKLNFKGVPVLALLLLTGILLKFVTKFLSVSSFFSDVIVVLANALITAGVLDILLAFSNQEKTMEEFSKRVYGHIDKIWRNDYFPHRFAQSLDILSSEPVAGDSGVTKDELQDKLQNYIKSLARYADVCTEPLIYIHNLDRQIVLRKSEKVGFVEVHTLTDTTYVNLKDIPYTTVHYPQFLRMDGSGASYRIIRLIVDGKDKTDEVRDRFDQAVLKPDFENSIYECGKRYEEEIPAHRAKRILMEAVHEMPISMFYQCRVLNLPCMKFSLQASLDPGFMEENADTHYVFRWTLFETRTDPPNSASKKRDTTIEGDNGMLYLTGEYMKPGGGFALTLGSISVNSYLYQTQELRRELYRDPDPFDKYYQLVQAAAAEGALKDALLWSNEACRRFPDKAEAFGCRALIECRLKDSDAGIKDANYALAIKDDAQFYIARGMCYLLQKTWELALFDFWNAYTREECEEAIAGIKEISKQWGIEAILNGAKRWKDIVDPERPTDEPLSIEQFTEALESARVYYEAILLIEPENITALLHYGGLLYKFAERDKALKLWENLVRLQESDYHYYLCAIACENTSKEYMRNEFCSKGLTCAATDNGMWHKKLQELLDKILAET